MMEEKLVFHAAKVKNSIQMPLEWQQPKFSMKILLCVMQN